MKTERSGVTAPPFFTSTLYGGGWSASFPSRSSSKQNASYPLDVRQSGLQNQSERFGIEKNRTQASSPESVSIPDNLSRHIPS
jgi:hypothetical protein